METKHVSPTNISNKAKIKTSLNTRALKWWGRLKGLVGRSPPLHMLKNALARGY